MVTAEYRQFSKYTLIILLICILCVLILNLKRIFNHSKEMANLLVPISFKVGNQGVPLYKRA